MLFFEIIPDPLSPEFWCPPQTYLGVVLGTIVTPTICLLGILCNFLSLIVLTRKELSGSVYSYLTVLGVMNLISLVLIFIDGIDKISFLQMDDFLRIRFNIFINTPVSGFCQSLSAMLTLAVALDRMLFLWDPLRTVKPKFSEPCVARCLIVVCFFIAFMVNLPYCFIFAVGWHGKIYVTEFYNSSYFKAMDWLKFILFGVISATLLTVINSVLVYLHIRLNQLNKKCRKVTGCKKKVDIVHLNLTLIITIYLFLIYNIPTLLLCRISTWTFFPKSEPNYMVLEYLREVTTVLGACCLSGNFLLYYLFCPPFLKAFKDVIKNNLDRKKRFVKRLKRREDVNINIFVLDHNRNPSKILEVINAKTNYSALEEFNSSEKFGECDRQ